MKLKISGCALFASLLLPAAGPKDSLQDLLARMDQAASSFLAMTANVHYLTHTAVIDDNAEESGKLAMRKVRDNEAQGRIDFLQPNPRSVTFEKRKVQVFTPKTKTVQVYDLGKHGEDLDRFLMIGFGSSGTELARDYDMKALGVETVQGQKAARLELSPKSDEIRKVISKIELWIPERPSQPYPLQEKIFQTGPGDYRLVNYSEVKINPALSADAMKLKLPARVKTEYPGK